MKNNLYTNGTSGIFNKWMLITCCIILSLFSVNTYAQIPVTVTNNTLTTPNLAASYTSLALALTDLNLVTAIAPGTVTLTLGAGAETTPNAGLTIGSATLNPALAAGAGASTIVLFNTGGTAVLNAGTTGAGTPGTAVQDGILKIVGADYITIDGLTLVDGNATNPTTMEFGIGLFKLSATDGAQNNTIQNCTITLNRINNASGTAPAVDGSRGLNIMNATPTAQTTILTVTSASGANSNNKFYTNTIQNCNIGIALIGFAAATPFTLADFNNDIGGSSGATGNIIKNYGGAPAASNPAAGIRTLAQYNLNISYNNVNSNDGGGVIHPSTLRGIYTNTATSASETISFNTVSIKGGGTTSAMVAIENVAGSTAAGNTISITNNTITGCTYTTATSGTFTGIFNNAATPATLNITNNQLTNNATNATSGTTNMIQNSGAVTLAVNINSNNINGMTYNSVTSGAFVGIVSSAAVSATTVVSISSNNIEGITYNALSTAANTYISCSGVPLTFTANLNTFTNLNVNTSGTVTFILETYSATATGTKNVTNNSIVTAFNRGGASGSTLLISDNGSSVLGSISNVLNNNFSNITVTGTSTITGINLTDGGTATTKTITGNTFNNFTGGTGTINVINVTYWTGVSVMSNNTVTNITGQGIVTGITMGATVNTATSITVASNTINNLTSTGAGGNVTGLVCTNTSAGISIRNNTINTLSTTGASIVTGISIGGAANTDNVLKNKICDLSGSNSASTVNGILVSAGTTVTLSNNIIGDLRAPAADAANPINGINITGGTTVNAYFNTVYIDAVSLGLLFGSSAVSAVTTATVTLNNNIFVNTSLPNGAGLAVAYRRSSTTLTSYAAASDRNDFFASTIFTDGTNTFTLLGPGVGTYKDFVATRDANSISENPPFISTTCGNANFLHISLSSATGVESGGASIAGITDDYDGHIRFGEIGYAGTGTAPDIGADELDGIPLPPCAGNPTAGTITGINSLCSGFGTTLSLTGTTVASGLSYQWSSGTTSGGPYSTPLGTGASQATGALTTTTYYIVTVTCANGGGTNSTAEHEVLVKPLPSVSVSPTSGSFCKPGGNAITITASGNSTSYLWSPTGGLSSNTDATVIADPNTTTIYTVTGTLNGCTSTATSSITILTGTSVYNITATPLNICSGNSSQLEAIVPCMNGAIKITEVTHFSTGTGETPSYPSYLASIPDDHVELSNISTFPVDVSGLIYEVWTGTTLSRTVTIPVGTILPANSVLIIGVGTATNDPANFYFNTGGTSPLSSSTAAGHLIKFGGSILDAVAMTSYSWPVASGVTVSDWTGSGLAASGRAGVIRSAAVDNNDVSDWVLSDEPSPVQSIGTYNGSYTFSGFGSCSSGLDYSWSPSTFLTSTTGSIVTASGVTGTTTYTVTVTVPSSGCTATGTVSVLVEPLVCGALTIGGADDCFGNQTVTAHPSGGGTPYSYAWTEDGNAFGGNTQTINASAGTHTYNCVITDFCSATCSSGDLVVITNALPVVAVSPTSAFICRPYEPAVTLTASGASTYVWSPAAGLSATTGTTVEALPLYSTNYTVTGTDANGCVNTASSNISIGITPLVLSATAFPPAVCSGATSSLSAFSYVPTITTVNNYVFLAEEDASLDPMTGATTVIAAINEGTPTGVLPIGFNFNFDGVDFTNYSVSPDGFIKLGDVAATLDATNAAADATNIPKIYAYWDDLHTGIDGSVKVLLSGTAPERILKVQWETTIPKAAAGNFNSTFQVWLYETGNIVEFRYGTMGVPATSSNGGITGNPATNFHSITFSTKTSSTSTANNTQIAVPASGTKFTYAPPSAAITYAWQPAADVVNSASQNTATVALTATTVFTVTATNGSCSTSSTTTVTAGEPLVCSAATASSLLCSLTDFTLTANHSGGGAPFTYLWSDGSTTVYPNAQTITANLPAGTYTFTCVVSDDCGESCNSDVMVTVLASPTVTVSIDPTSGQICKPNPVDVTLTASGASTYSWSPVSGLTPNTGAVVMANPSSTVTYVVTGTDVNGCASTGSAAIVVGNTPSNVTASATPPTICSGSTSQLSSTAEVTVTADNYLFSTSTGGSLADMTSATTLIGGSAPVGSGYGDDDIALPNPSPIGFDFVFEGVTYSDFAVSPDGWIKLGSVAATEDFTNAVTDATNLPKLYPFWDDLNIGTDGHVKVLLSGSTPSQILILEWKVAVGTTLTNPSTTTFQAWLYETSNVIEFYYGTMANAISASAGITGAPQTNYNSISFATNSSSSTAVNNTNIFSPASGRVYTFTPPDPITYSWQPSAGLTPNANVQNPGTPVLTSTTVYTVTATQNGCSATATTTVFIEPLACTAPTVSPVTCASTNFTVTANHTGGGFPYSYSWSDGSTTSYPDAQSITANLAVGSYTISYIVTDDCGSTCGSSVNVTVNGLPTVSVNPSSGQICNPNGTAVTLTASGATTYTWSPASGLSATTGSIVSVNPASSTNFTVTGTDGNGCNNTAISSIQVGYTPSNAIATATPANICPGTFSQLDVSTVCSNSIIMTEVTVFRTGAGATNPYPSWIVPTGVDDWIEVSNISISPVDVSGLVFEYWEGTAMVRTLTVPPGTIIPALQVMIFGIGTGTDDPANRYFLTGGANNVVFSSDPWGYLIKQGSTIIDVVTSSTYSWPVSSGVVASDWTGPGLAIPSTAGATRTAMVDNNSNTDWTIANASNVQTLGTYNGVFTVSSCVLDFSWEPNAGLKPNSFVQSPETPGLFANTVYTVTITNNGCSSTATTTVYVEPLACLPATSSSILCNGGNFTVTAHHTGGGAPFSYAWSDGAGGVYPDAATITANLPAGIYTFDCTVTDDCGNSCISSVTVTVNGLPTVSVSPSSGIICNPGGDAVTLTASGGVSYTWSPTTGLTPSTGTTVSAKPSLNTTYIVTGTDVNGCTSTSSADIVVGQKTVMTASVTPSSICPGSTAQLSSSASVPSALTADQYLFSASSGTFTTLTGGTVVTFSTLDDARTGPITLGFNFVYEGLTYSSVFAGTNGWLAFADPGENLLTNNLQTGVDRPIIAPLWDDLASTSGGVASYSTTGVSGSQVFTFEWLNWEWRFTATVPVISFQAKLYEVDGHIEFIYQDEPGVTNATSTSGASIGISGVTSGNFLALDNTSASPTVNNVTENKLLFTEPASGQVYTFTPPASPVVDYSWSPAAGLVPNSTDQNPMTPPLSVTTVYTVTGTFNICSSTATVSVTVAVIEDNNVCTIDGCDTNTGLATHTPVNVDDGDPCTTDGCNSITGVFHTPICNVTLNSNIILQGYYSGGGLMQIAGVGYLNVPGVNVSLDPTDVDYVSISAMDPLCPHGLVDEQIAVLKTDGSISVTFSLAVVPGNSYYLRVKHWNSVETWSAAPVVLSGITFYSFSSAATQAFAANQVATFDNLYYAIIAGDINQDGAVDGSDFLELDPKIQNGEGGFNVGDLNGDGAVDGSDFLVLDPNIQLGLGAATPLQFCP